jgi:hypothetical protein
LLYPLDDVPAPISETAPVGPARLGLALVSGVGAADLYVTGVGALTGADGALRTAGVLVAGVALG